MKDKFSGSRPKTRGLRAVVGNVCGVSGALIEFSPVTNVVETIEARLLKEKKDRLSLEVVTRKVDLGVSGFGTLEETTMSSAQDHGNGLN
jgi:hypothetical protein